MQTVSRLNSDFGLELITRELIDKIEILTGANAHPFLTRQIFNGHRDLDIVLTDAIEKKQEICLYSGIGPSSASLHLGHYIQFSFLQYLQSVFKCKVVIQIADDEKLFSKNLDDKTLADNTASNIKDIIALGFDSQNTFIFCNSSYRQTEPAYESIARKLKSLCSIRYLKHIFGFTDDANVGSYETTLYQVAAGFTESYPQFVKTPNCKMLVTMAVDQDNYFRMARDLAPKLKLPKPATIVSNFLPCLTGKDKASSTFDIDQTIFLSDTTAEIKAKIKKHCFSAGGGTGSLADHRKYGGDINKDVAMQYLLHFIDSTEELKQIQQKFASGTITCREVKEILMSTLCAIVEKHRLKRTEINKTDVETFMCKVSK